MIFNTCYVNVNSVLLEPGTYDYPVTYSCALGEGIYIPNTDWHKFDLVPKLIEMFGAIENIPNHWQKRKLAK